VFFILPKFGKPVRFFFNPEPRGANFQSGRFRVIRGYFLSAVTMDSLPDRGIIRTYILSYPACRPHST